MQFWSAPVPIMCGGESEAALRRAARLCDGWVGTACVWDDAVRYNFDLTQNVYEAAVRRGAKRLMFASSNWTMVGHRFAEGALTTPRTGSSHVPS